MMENTLVFLLLLCSFSSAHGSEQDDINTVLRDMSAALAEHYVKIEQLQTINQEQAAKLEELEEQSSEVEHMKELLEEQAAKLKELEQKTSEIDPMKEQLQAQIEEVESAHMNITLVETLWRDRTAGQVAFSACLTYSGSVNLGPLNTETTLVFKYVVSNFGSAYNSNTGVFTAPLRGAYHFEFYTGAQGHPNGAGVSLMMNAWRVVTAYEHQTNAFGKSANGVTLFLRAGDAVYLRLWQQSRIHDSRDHHSTFSGHLLCTM